MLLSNSTFKKYTKVNSHDFNKVDERNKKYLCWNYPKELEERRLPLIRLKVAGHIKHTKEIDKIIEAMKAYKMNMDSNSDLHNRNDVCEINIGGYLTTKSIHYQFAVYSPPYERKIDKTGEWKFVFFSNNPNELVDRLRHLMIEQQAGNGNHINEIVEIIEALKEFRVIE